MDQSGQNTIRAVRPKLLRWYRRHRRDLPWRAGTPSALAGETPDPYHVLVSETMLQQTRVATVVGYFKRFVAEFPDVATLAAADEQRVLRAWQGLGYYRRARSLHAAAKTIVDRHGGAVPSDAEALRQLPGVGRYTAGAVASIAFDRPAAILDGNVARVLARLRGIDTPVDAPATRKRLWSLAASYAEGRSPGDANQALMELGATVCTPRTPRCPVCPVADHCHAAETGRAESLPVKRPKKKPAAVAHAIVAAERRGRWLFERRSDDGLWAGMWQLPTCEDADAADAAGGLPAWLRSRHGLAATGLRKLASFRHATTHRAITFDVLVARGVAGRLSRDGRPRRWVALDAVDELPLANPQRRVVEMLRGADASR